jgi:hypothetical protein
MKEYVRCIVSNEHGRHYMSHRVQNDLSRKLSEEVTGSIVRKIHKMKYFFYDTALYARDSHQK